MYTDKSTAPSAPSKMTEEYEISQKFCERLGFSVVLQRPLGSGEKFKCLSSGLCGNDACADHTS